MFGEAKKDTTTSTSSWFSTLTLGVFDSTPKETLSPEENRRWRTKFELYFPEQYAKLAKKQNVNFKDEFEASFKEAFGHLKPLEQKLFIAVIEGNLQDLKKLVRDNHLTINVLNIHISNGFHTISLFKKAKQQLMLDYFYELASAHIHSQSSQTLLHWAVRFKQSEEVILDLIQQGYDINARTKPANNTPLILAVREGNIKVAALLIKHGANVNLFNSQGNTALHIAAKQNNLGMVTLLLQGHARRGIANIESLLPHQCATDQRIIGLLSDTTKDSLEIKKETSATQARSLTSITPAENTRWEDKYKLYFPGGYKRLTHTQTINFKKAFEDNFKQIFGGLSLLEQQLFIAVIEGTVEDLKRLVAANKLTIHRLDIEVCHEQHSIFLFKKAKQQSMLDYFYELAIAACPQEVPPVPSQRLLHWAVKCRQSEAVIDGLVQQGYSVDAQSVAHNRTPLLTALMYGNRRAAALLITKHGADVNLGSRYETPLHLAAKQNDLEMVTLLLHYHAVGNIKDRTNSLPCDLTTDPKIKALLSGTIEDSEESKAETSTPSILSALNFKLTLPILTFTDPLLTAACSDIDKVKQLINEGANVNVRDTHNQLTPLFVAVMHQKADIVGLLLQHKADPNHYTIQYGTPLHYAAQANDTNLATLLLQGGAKKDITDSKGNYPWQVSTEPRIQDLLRFHALPTHTPSPSQAPVLKSVMRDGQRGATVSVSPTSITSTLLETDEEAAERRRTIKEAVGKKTR